MSTLAYDDLINAELELGAAKANLMRTELSSPSNTIKLKHVAIEDIKHACHLLQRAAAQIEEELYTPEGVL